MAGWRNDYQAMRLMFIGEPPTFESLLESIKGIESELRACH
jgi:hypothetical protein